MVVLLDVFHTSEARGADPRDEGLAGPDLEMRPSSGFY